MIWGDDVGIHNISAYSLGVMGYKTPNIWPGGGTTPFKGERGTTWEGGFRVPCIVRWPGVVKPGTVINDIMSQEDWMPTLVAAAGEPDVVAKLEKGYQANGRNFRIRPDGYNFLPFLKGDVRKGPREEIYYFGRASSTPSAGTTGRCTSPPRSATSAPPSAPCPAGR